MGSTAIHNLLQDLQIGYDAVTHPPVYTCEEARNHVPNLVGHPTKNLFLRDKNKTRYFLVAVAEEKSVDLKRLAERINCSKLSFGSPEDLMTILALEPGSVSLLALINDHDCRVELIIDSDIWDGSPLQCHPLVNTETLSIPKEGIEKLIARTQHKVKVVEIPVREIPTVAE